MEINLKYVVFTFSTKGKRKPTVVLRLDRTFILLAQLFFVNIFFVSCFWLISLSSLCYVIWLSLVSDYSILRGCEEIVEFFRCCDCDRPIPSFANLSLFFSLSSSKELHQRKSIYVFSMLDSGYCLFLLISFPLYTLC